MPLVLPRPFIIRRCKYGSIDYIWSSLVSTGVQQAIDLRWVGWNGQ